MKFRSKDKAFSIASCFAVLAMGSSLASHAQAVRQEAPIISEDIANRIDAMIYEANSTSRLVFRGSALVPRAEGKAVVKAGNNQTEVDAEFSGLLDPSTLGPYTVYALWAITPEGRSTLLGTMPWKSNGRAGMEVTSPHSGYAMIVTLEPHFLVSVPSKQVALTSVATEFKGRRQVISTLDDRADYAGLQPQRAEKRKPLIVDQARYAVAIAAAADAANVAGDAYRAASTALAAAESAWTSRKSKERKRAPELARIAIQAGEDARVAAIRRTAELKREAEQQAAERAKLVAAEEAARATAANVNASAANQRAASAEERAAQLRRDLLQRMNAVLPTRDTERGLVAEIGGVQFATGKSTLNPGARETLARLSGVLAAYPGISIKVEGHTDSTGSAETNRLLSVGRALAVRDYLVAQGVSSRSVESDGLGPSMPVADNATQEGRARNRRVEIVVSNMDAATVN